MPTSPASSSSLPHRRAASVVRPGTGKLLAFRGQKRSVFLPGIGPGKAGNNGIQEVVGSIPIGSTTLCSETPELRMAGHFYSTRTCRHATTFQSGGCPPQPPPPPRLRRIFPEVLTKENWRRGTIFF